MNGDCGKMLVVVRFAKDDLAPDETFHTMGRLWLSENCIGGDDDIYDWAVQGWSRSEPQAQQKSQLCRELLVPLAQPKDLPDSPNRIVTIQYLDGDEVNYKYFAIDRVPKSVREALILIGFDSNEYAALGFC